MDDGVFLCECRDARKFAEDAYQTLFPDAPSLPPFYQGSDEIAHLSTSIPSGSQLREYLAGLTRNRRKFSYYIVWDATTGAISTLINLKDGRRVV